MENLKIAGTNFCGKISFPSGIRIKVSLKRKILFSLVTKYYTKSVLLNKEQQKELSQSIAKYEDWGDTEIYIWICITKGMISAKLKC